MPRKILFIVGLILITTALFIAGCSAGPQGSEGPIGPAGPAGPQGPAGPPGEDASVRLEYVGAEKCGECHEDAYAKYTLSGHASNFTKVVDGQAPVYAYDNVTGGISRPPEGYTWEDISYVVGGYGWKALFVDSKGYVITNPPGETGVADYENQFNFANEDLEENAGWSSYHSGEEQTPMECASCHTTGYHTEGHQDDLEGIVGTWAFENVQCEACHGAGSLHASDPYGFRMVLDRTNQACGECHSRESVTHVEAANGFAQQYQQFDQLYNSEHFAVQCIACHDPHASTVHADPNLNPTAGIRQTCDTCHWENVYQNNEEHVRLECTDCHMAKAGQSALANLEVFTGDLSSHLFSINPDPNAPQFNEDGTLSMPYLTLNYACNNCHGVFATAKDMQELADMAEGYHTRPEPTATPSPELTPEATVTP
ncbi:MAG TPA: multiheme c-type cytochrome [Anaerolineales bacterium]|nr:multiheme c-type cytochrome [Anaerolineales bacterium]